jgi:hypothetical protein
LYQQQYYDSGASASAAKVVTVGTTPVSGLDIFLPQWGSISGHVSLGDASRSAGASEVKVTMTNTCTGSKVRDDCVIGPPRVAYTGEDGDYSFIHLENDVYTLAFAYLPDGAFRPPPKQTVTISTDNTTRVADATMRTAGSISGHVWLGTTSVPAGAGQVLVSVPGGTQTNGGAALTDASGEYVLRGLTPGNYVLHFDYLPSGAFADEYYGHYYADRGRPTVGVGPGGETGNANAVLAAGASVSGQVTNFAGDPVPGVQVVAKAYFGYVAGGSAYSDEYSVTADSQGRYSLSGLPAGNWSITFEAPVGYRQSTLGVHVSAGDALADRDVTLYQGNTAAGWVTCVGCTADHYPIYDGSVEREGPAGNWTAVDTGGMQSKRENGYFELRNVLPGTYRITLSSAGRPDIYVPPFDLGDGANVNLAMAGQPFTGTFAPTLGGAVRVGSTLTVSKPALTPTPTTYTYRWSRDGAPVPGGATRLVQPDDVGHVLTVIVHADRVGYGTRTATLVTVPVAPGPITSRVPSITGTARVGSTLTAKAGAWSAASTLTYQWFANGVPVSMATGATYVLSPPDFGKRITVAVTGSGPAYISATKKSAPTVAVTASPFAAAGVPLISGTAQVGRPLTVVPGTWNPGATLTYRWYANGVAIRAATSPTFTPSGSQLGKKITVRVTGSAFGYVTTSKVSVTTASVARGVYPATPDPNITGVARVGSPLTADTAGWQPGATFAYQWYANGAAISKATSKTYVPSAALLGKVVTVKVRPTTPGYQVLPSMTAGPADPIAAGQFITTSVPTISGTAKVGSTLKVTAHTWSPTATLKYQWLADGTPISGATSTAYKLPASKAGAVISVRVTGSKAGFVTVSQDSVDTAPVAP